MTRWAARWTTRGRDESGRGGGQQQHLGPAVTSLWLGLRATGLEQVQEHTIQSWNASVFGLWGQEAAA